MSVLRTAEFRNGRLFVGLSVGFMVGVAATTLFLPDHPDQTLAASGADEFSTSLGTTDVTGGAGTTTDDTTDAVRDGTTGESSAGASSGTGPQDAAGTPLGVSGGGGGENGETVTVKLGIACLDLGALSALGPDFDVGDCEKQYMAALEMARAEILPGTGLDIELAFREVDMLDASSQRAACVGLIQEDRVFAVIAPAPSTTGILEDCVTKEFKTPLLGMGGETPATDARLAGLAPYYFVLGPTTSRMARNLPHFIESHGLFEKNVLGDPSVKVGIYYRDATLQRDEFQNMKQEMQALGRWSQVAEIMTTDQELGGPEDIVAARRFQTGMVDVAILRVDPIAQANFMNAAESQGYRPRYVVTDSEDAGPANYPAAQFDGMLSMSAFDNGLANTTDSPKAAACRARYKQAHGAVPDRTSSADNFMRRACDLMAAATHALVNGGREVSHGSYIAGAEAIRDLEGAIMSSASFGPGRHAGGDAQKTQRWVSACTCFHTAGPFAPFWVP
jgi:hypothetical protein